MDSHVELFKSALKKTAALLTATAESSVPQVAAELAVSIHQSLANGGKILLAGNGGSAADAQHIAAEFVNYFSYPRPALRAIALTTDTSVLTAVGNDTSYQTVFSRQVEALGDAGDILWLYSTSGRSKNVIEAAKVGKSKGLIVAAFLGSNAAEFAQYADYCLEIPSTTTPNIQEAHLVIGHAISGLVEEMFFGPKPE